MNVKKYIKMNQQDDGKTKEMIETAASTERSTNSSILGVDKKLCTSVESVLGVPSNILFRRVAGRRPLLTRPEVEKFLRVTLLAQEIDVLVRLSSKVLERHRFSKTIRHHVLLQRDTKDESVGDDPIPWTNPYLTPIVIILDVLEGQQILSHELPKTERNNHRDILWHINNQLMRLCHELLNFCVPDLENSADQNKECFMPMTAEYDEDGSNKKPSSVQMLAQEKIALSELQEYLSKKIRLFLKIFRFRHENDAVEKFTEKKGKDSPLLSPSFGKQNLSVICTDDNGSRLSSSCLSSPVSTGANITSIRAGGCNMDKSNDDESCCLLSLEEIMTPITMYCEKLFSSSDSSTVIDQQEDSISDYRTSDKGIVSSRSIPTCDKKLVDASTIVLASTSQRTTGVAAAMVEMTNKHDHIKLDATNHRRHNYDSRFNEANASINQQHQKQEKQIKEGYQTKKYLKYHNKYSAVGDDSSIIDDPSEDDSNGKKLGIFDTVDVLTPPSQQETLYKQQGNNKRKKLDNTTNLTDNYKRLNYSKENLSSLPSESQQTAAVALAQMIHGNR